MSLDTMTLTKKTKSPLNIFCNNFLVTKYKFPQKTTIIAGLIQ